MKKLLLIFSLLAISCGTDIKTNSPNDKNLTSELKSIIGKAEFPEKFTTKATLSQVGSDATVSIIYPNDHPSNANKTIATGLTDASGVFTINPDNSFAPNLNEVFVLEATKRIGSTGNDLLTIRTLIKWTGNSWKSMTKHFNNNTWPIFINTKTTALAAISTYNPNLTSGDTIGTIDITTGNSVPTNIIGTGNSIPATITVPPVLNVDIENNVIDRSGNSINGTHLGGATYSNDRNTNTNSALDLNGTNSYVKFPSGTIFENPNMTFSIWAKSNTSTWNTNGWLANYRTDVDGNGFVLFPSAGSSDISISVGNSGTWKFTTGFTVTDITQWHNYTFTNDGSMLKLFVDGVKVSETTSGGITYGGNALAEGLSIGYVSPGSYGNGTVDDIKLFNYALSESQVTDLFNHTPQYFNVTTQEVIDVAAKVSSLLGSNTDPNSFLANINGDFTVRKFSPQKQLLIDTNSCIGCFLAGEDLSNLNLTSANLTGSNINGSNVSGANFTNVDMTNIKGTDGVTNDFSNFDFTGVTLTGSTFTGANLLGTNFTNVDMTAVKGSNGVANDFSNIDFTNANFSGANLTGAKFNGANLTGVKFNGANLTGVNLTNANLANANLANANLTNAILLNNNNYNQYSGTNFTNVDMTTVKGLSGIVNNFSTYNFILCNFTNANFTNANLGAAGFTNSTLTNSTLTNANLHSSWLVDTNLTGASLNGATLTGANLTNANLNNANLTGAMIQGTNFTNALLFGTIWTDGTPLLP